MQLPTSTWPWLPRTPPQLPAPAAGSGRRPRWQRLRTDDVVYPQDGDLATVAILAPVVLSALLLEHNHLRAMVRWRDVAARPPYVYACHRLGQRTFLSFTCCSTVAVTTANGTCGRPVGRSVGRAAAGRAHRTLEDPMVGVPGGSVRVVRG